MVSSSTSTVLATFSIYSTISSYLSACSANLAM
uniref:Csu614a n=1 Tax=Arundo donax TaxID=35708 RepID=A0A0A9ETY9_ARUDO